MARAYSNPGPEPDRGGGRWSTARARVKTATGADDRSGDRSGDRPGYGPDSGYSFDRAIRNMVYGRPESDRLRDPDAAGGERAYATAMHLSLLAFFMVPIVLPALVLWAIRREESPYLDDHGREVVNFQLSLLIYSLAAGALAATVIGLVITIPAIPLIVMVGAIGMIRGAIAASRGEFYRAPMTLRLIPPSAPAAERV